MDEAVFALPIVAASARFLVAHDAESEKVRASLFVSSEQSLIYNPGERQTCVTLRRAPS